MMKRFNAKLPRSPLRHRMTAVVAALLTILIPGCAVDPNTGAQRIAGIKVSDDPCSNVDATVGTALGVVGGALIGRAIGKGTGVTVAAAAGGGLVGGLIGHDMDRRRCEYFKIARKYSLTLTVNKVSVPKRVSVPAGSPPPPVYSPSSGNDVAGLSVTVRDTGHQFATGSDHLSTEARAYFAEIGAQDSYTAQVAKFPPNASQDDRTAVDSLRTKRILLVGHTDDSGDSRINADLSERRALAVARVFEEQGIPRSQIFYQGAGETLPIGDNRTDEGRAMNRRVEIVDVTDDDTFRRYLASRKQELAYIRPAHAPSSVMPAGAVVTNVRGPRGNEGQPGSAAATTRPAIPSAPTGGAPASQTATTRPVVAAESAAGVTPSAGIGTLPYFDFGGDPVAKAAPVRADFGNEIPAKHGVSLFPTAYAAENSVVPSCSTDRPRIANGVKSLRDQKAISVTEYLPGLYDTSWFATLNGNLVGITHVAVYRDGGSPAARPEVLVYRDFKAGTNPRHDFAAFPEVNTYRGDKALLYRVFIKGPMRCMDIVFPYDNSGVANNSSLYYDHQDELFVVAFKPKMAR